MVACKAPENAADLYFYDSDSLRSGDIILRKSYGLLSDIIVARLHDTVDISHCGILVKEADSSFCVIHALAKSVSEADGVQKCSLKKFMADSRPETVKVVRFKNDSDKRIAGKALYYLAKKVKFDNNFNLKDTTAFYCSELPYHILKQEFDFSVSDESHLLKFSVFFNPQFFSIVPFVKQKNVMEL